MTENFFCPYAKINARLLLTNGVVMDLLGGSGSTLMACDQTDRICRTMELDPRYASVIVQRYVDAAGADGVKVLRDGSEMSYSEVTA